MAYLKEFLKYTSLNVMGMIGLSCYILADTFFIAQGLGADGLTALNLAIPIYSFIHGSGLMIGMGGGTRYSIRKSQGSAKHAEPIFTNAARLAGALSAVFFLTGLFLSGTIARMVGAGQAVFEMSRIYLKVVLLFGPMFMMNNLLLCFVRNDGAPHRSMAAMIGGSLSNILLDYLFIFPLGMGIFGAALATGLAPIISMAILSPYFFQKKNCFHLEKCGISIPLAVRILSSGLPSLITEVSSGIVIIVFNILILRLQGNTGVAAYGVIANLSLVVMAVYTGIAQGIQPILSQGCGAGNREKVRSVLRYALCAVLLLSVLIFAFVYLRAPQIVSVFNSGQNELLQKIAEDGLKIYFTGCLFAGFNIVLSVYYTSTARPLPAHIISLLRGFLLILPLAFLLSSVGGMTGVWCAFPATELLVSLAGCGMYWRLTARKEREEQLYL